MQHPSFFVRVFMPNTAKQYTQYIEEANKKREEVLIKRELIEKKNTEWKNKMKEQEKLKKELYDKYDTEKEERKREGMEIYNMCLEEVYEQKLREIKRKEIFFKQVEETRSEQRINLWLRKETKLAELLSKQHEQEKSSTEQYIQNMQKHHQQKTITIIANHL